MMALMRALATVLFRQLDATAFDLVDGTDMNAVGADDFHVIFDLGHWIPSVSESNSLERQTFIERPTACTPATMRAPPKTHQADKPGPSSNATKKERIATRSIES